MIRRLRWLRYGILAVAIALVVGMGGFSASGQTPDERDELIARLQAQIAERDTLIAAQESLLNDYRCLFDVDTQLVPGGCAGPTQPPPDTIPEETASPPELPAGTTQEQWDHLIQCESGGNYRAYNPAGPYLGAFQFNQPTWNGVASRHHPHLVGVDPRDAAPADQHRMAYALWEERGWQPWPHCGAPFGSP